MAYFPSTCHLCGLTRDTCKNKYCSDNPKFVGTKSKKIGLNHVPNVKKIDKE